MKIIIALALLLLAPTSHANALSDVESKMHAALVSSVAEGSLAIISICTELHKASTKEAMLFLQNNAPELGEQEIATRSVKYANALMKDCFSLINNSPCGSAKVNHAEQ